MIWALLAAGCLVEVECPLDTHTESVDTGDPDTDPGESCGPRGAPTTGSLERWAGEAHEGLPTVAGDVDNDGEAEVVLGRPDGEGPVHALEWSGGLYLSGTLDTGGVLLDRIVLPGDLTGHGAPDVVLGTGRSGGGGAEEVYLLEGPWSGDRSLATEGTLLVSGQGAAGESLAAVELWDGRALVVGAPVEQSRGHAWVFRSPVGGSPSASLEIRGSPGQAVGSWVGTPGDMDGDGDGEVAVSDNAARAFVFPARDTGSTMANTADLALVGSAAASQEVMTLAGGDLDGDGYADLVAGNPYRSSFTGAVWVILGGTGVYGKGNIPVTAADHTVDIDLAHAGLGGGLLVADVDGDLSADLVIGAIGDDAGKVFVVHGPLAGDLELEASSWSPRVDGRPGEQLGHHMSAVDMDRDECVDLVLGSAAGVYVWLGE